eukprot:m.526506 g.526506  ORF g.526506 m.526506 type:complete len:399 (+) comp22002_c0_seq1:1259-2455(+)
MDGSHKHGRVCNGDTVGIARRHVAVPGCIRQCCKALGLVVRRLAVTAAPVPTRLAPRIVQVIHLGEKRVGHVGAGQHAVVGCLCPAHGAHVRAAFRPTRREKDCAKGCGWGGRAGRGTPLLPPEAHQRLNLTRVAHVVECVAFDAGHVVFTLVPQKPLDRCAQKRHHLAVIQCLVLGGVGGIFAPCSHGIGDPLFDHRPPDRRVDQSDRRDGCCPGRRAFVFRETIGQLLRKIPTCCRKFKEVVVRNRDVAVGDRLRSGDPREVGALLRVARHETNIAVVTSADCCYCIIAGKSELHGQPHVALSRAEPNVAECDVFQCHRCGVGASGACSSDGIVSTCAHAPINEFETGKKVTQHMLTALRTACNQKALVDIRHWNVTSVIGANFTRDSVCIHPSVT